MAIFMNHEPMPQQPPEDLIEAVERIKREHPGSSHVFMQVPTWAQVVMDSGLSAVGIQLLIDLMKKQQNKNPKDKSDTDDQSTE